MNFKTNKRKFVAKIMLLVLLVTSAFSFTGCAEPGKYKFGADYSQGTNTCAIAYANTNTFDIDNVTLTIFYGIHELNALGQVEGNPKKQFAGSYANDKLKFEICICSNTTNHDGFGMGFKDVRCCAIYKILEEEQFLTQEYGYIDTPFFISNGMIFKHSETIKIPSYFFSEDYGLLRIRFFLFFDDSNQNIIFDDSGNINIYKTHGIETCIRIKYKKTDDGKVELHSNG